MSASSTHTPTSSSLEIIHGDGFTFGTKERETRESSALNLPGSGGTLGRTQRALKALKSLMKQESCANVPLENLLFVANARPKLEKTYYFPELNFVLVN